MSSLCTICLAKLLLLTMHVRTHISSDLPYLYQCPYWKSLLEQWQRLGTTPPNKWSKNEEKSVSLIFLVHFGWSSPCKGAHKVWYLSAELSSLVVCILLLLVDNDDESWLVKLYFIEILYLNPVMLLLVIILESISHGYTSK